MKIITEAMVEENLSMEECIPAMRQAMIAVSTRKITLPLRQFMPIHDTDGKLAFMPGAISDPDCFGVKLVCKYPREANSPYGTHVGFVMVFDSKLGIPLAMIEGASLTAIRTSAASALATDLLARENCQHMTILGCGEQAARHITSMLAVRNPKKITVWGRSFDKASSFANHMTNKLNRDIQAVKTAREAVENADLICTTTSSRQPILNGDWVKQGAHVNLVGAAIPASAEADQSLVTRAKFIVDFKDAALVAAGEFLRAKEAGVIDDTHIIAEIGEIANGLKPGRASDQEITVYKSLGVAAQDLAAAHILYKKSLDRGFGIDVNMMDYDHS